jgi:3-oxoacyl-ACP reductase-like protein
MQGELHGGAPSQETPVVVAATPALSEPVIAPIQKSAEPSPAPEDEFEFSDTAALMCLLCSRQFKSLDQLKRHNKESDLHKVRLADL